MKVFANFITFAIILVATNAAITRPDQVYTFQSPTLDHVKTLRSTITDIQRKYYNESLAAIEDNIKTIAATDTATRNTLVAQTQSPCVTNLANCEDQITELSGYAISNCIDAQDSENDKASSDALTTLVDFDIDVNSFAVVIINALIGRNIFTEGQAIVDRVQEQLDAKKTKYADLFV